MASTAKIMTALAVLTTRPLTSDHDATPIITLTQADVDIYNSFVAKDGSVILVAAGERISEYQALQAMLLPSADNMADSLAIWAFGSLHAYTTYANQLAAQLGLKDTHLADASGLSPASTSTAADLVKLSLAAMNKPAFADIVRQPSAVVPVAGRTRNCNFLLGRDGIIGVKTGSTDESGGVFVVAASHQIGGRTITVTATVMGESSLRRSMLDSVPLLLSAEHNFVRKVIMRKDTTVGTYDAPWGSEVNLITTKNLNLVVWGGSSIRTTDNIESLHVATNFASSSVGTVLATSGGVSAHVPIVTSGVIADPSLWFRMRHPIS